MESGVPSLRLNSKFNSYTEFENYLKVYEEENNVQLWKRDARKIEKMQGRAPNKNYLCWTQALLCPWWKKT